MAKEYLLSCTTEIGFELDDSFDVTTESNLEDSYLVSNIPFSNAEIYAPEINFYYENSKDNEGDKFRNIKKLYEARALGLEHSEVLEFSVLVGNKVAIISDSPQPVLAKRLVDKNFSCLEIDSSEVVSITGYIGNLTIHLKQNSRMISIDQVIWPDAADSYVSMEGVHGPFSENMEELVEALIINRGERNYVNHIKHDNTYCLHKLKRENGCQKCVDICPTGAIASDIKIKISDIQCQSCGSCVTICPSGALDSAHIPRSVFTQICSLFEGFIPLVLPHKIDLTKTDIKIEKGVLPFSVIDLAFLDEGHLLTLLQATGNPIILYVDQVSEILNNILRVVNDIFLRKDGRQAIYVCKNAEELSLVFKQATPFDNLLYFQDEPRLKKREIFANCLSNYIGNDDFGVVETGPHLHYGNIKINQNACTLCLSCVDVCKVGALTSNAEDHTLRYKPSICTQCGHCENICPEQNCLQLVHGQLSLNQSYFSERVVAKDELFKCVECGTGFAPSKSISKIKSMMTPVFSGDPLKLKSLSCCPDCKARVMLESLNIEE